MRPEETGSHYDRIALWWQQKHLHSTYGMAALERAIKFTKNKSTALDIGCGSSGRFIDVSIKHGFTPTGLDVSAEMIALARKRHPDVTFYIEDIGTWQLPQKYDLISAWDSSFHLPLAEQKPVLKKMCEGLNPNGVLLFTCGGGTGPEEISGGFEGQAFDYSTLGVDEFLRLTVEFGCTCKHLEYDQFPENHVYIIAQKVH
ncbi:MAG TPA: class I SAM-dependent methyltransferase [Anaerolineales bacterium]|nr:class I SAM-dependent methyltransferase [Anaerolineales bacterium]